MRTAPVVAEIIAPLRGEPVTVDGISTVRFAEYLEEVSGASSEIDQILLDIAALTVRVVNLEGRMDAVEATVQDVVQQIADLIADNGKLHARLNEKDRQINNVTQIAAGLE